MNHSDAPGTVPAERLLRGLALAAFAVSVFGGGGCAVGPDHIRPPVDMPGQWRPELAAEGVVSDTWWTLYHDATLNTLVGLALEHNHDLAIAIARIDEAKACLSVARSAQWPSLSAEAGSSRGKVSGLGETDNSHALSGSLSFELDLWGKYRRATEAARAQLLATEAAYGTVRLSVIAETARAYFSLLSTDRQLKTARETLAVRRQAEKLYRSRYREGLSGEYEWLQSQVETTTALAEVQSREMAVVQSENALAVLIGRTPPEIVEERLARPVLLDDIPVPHMVPAGLPSMLLDRRPDIIEAEETLHAVTANIGVAKAAFLPDFSLTGLFGWASPQFERLVMTATRQWSLGAGVLQPLFQGGRLRAELATANARQRAAYAAFQKVVANAYREVLDALVAARITRERLVTIQTQVKTLRRTVSLANLRYRSGHTNFLEVLDAQRSLFAAEMELAQAYQAQLDAVATLCQTLGGGWERPAE